MRKPGELDLHYTDPRLAEVYDATCGWSEDLDFYLSLATRPVMRVLDLGCGTGSLCDAFAARGHEVTGVDPSAAMLDVARRKAHAADVRWVEAFSQDFLADGPIDLVTMTGHAFQTLLLDDDVASLFARVAACLSADGVFAFESRNPTVDWRAEWDGRREVHDSPRGGIRCSIRVTEAVGETLSFEQAYAFEDETLVSASTLRFMGDERIASLLVANGLEVSRLRGDWTGGPFVRERSREMIFEVAPARRSPWRGGRRRTGPEFSGGPGGDVRSATAVAGRRVREAATVVGMDHETVVERNRAAWTANAYRAWVARYGTAERAAAELVADPRRPLRRVLGAIGDPSGRTIANPLGSHGRVATAFALLGAEVTAFDVAESNARYARELAGAAGVPLIYVVGDFLETAFDHAKAFDAVVMDLGIVHYFVDIGRFAAATRALLPDGGTLVLSEFHPLVKKALDVSSGEPRLRGDYFATGIEGAPTPCDVFLNRTSPDCALRRWTLGEIVTAFASGGFRIGGLAEHPSAECPTLPGTFTLVATAD